MNKTRIAVMAACAAALLLLSLCSLDAHATNEPAKPAPPKQAMTPAQIQQAQKQAQEAISRADARAVARAAAQAQGGTATAAGGASSSDNAVNLGGDSSNSRAWSLFLPPLAFVPPMAPMTGCSPDVQQSSVGVAFGAYSAASSHADPQDCTLMQLRNAKVEQCQYASAKAIEDLMIAKKLPDYRPSAVQFVDYAPQDCAALRAPPPPSPVVNYVREVTLPPACPVRKKTARKPQVCK